MKRLLFSFFLGLSFLFVNSARGEETPQTINFWHSMSGSPQEKLNKIIQKFNDSQKEVRVNALLKGNYTESLNALVAAYRGGKQPHLTQVFEVGTQSMMLSGAILPVEDLFIKNGLSLPKKDFLEPIFNYYSNNEGKLISMPFNSSTPIVYYNEELTKKLNIKKIPETWDELFQSAKEIHDKSGLCGLVFGWQSWTLIENFSAINNIALAEPENGFKGLDVKMNLKNPEIVQNISRIAEAIQKNCNLIVCQESLDS